MFLPDNLANEFPELNIHYKNKFIFSAKKVIEKIDFEPSETEKKYLIKLNDALQDQKLAYNSVHTVIQQMDLEFKKGFLSVFKDHMKPIRNEIIKLMKAYNTNKSEYITKIGYELK